MSCFGVLAALAGWGFLVYAASLLGRPFVLALVGCFLIKLGAAFVKTAQDLKATKAGAKLLRSTSSSRG